MFLCGIPTSLFLILQMSLPSPLPQGDLPPCSLLQHLRSHRGELGHIQAQTNMPGESCTWQRRLVYTSHRSCAPPGHANSMQSRPSRTSHGNTPKYSRGALSKSGLEERLGPSRCVFRTAHTMPTHQCYPHTSRASLRDVAENTAALLGCSQSSEWGGRGCYLPLTWSKERMLPVPDLGQGADVTCP